MADEIHIGSGEVPNVVSKVAAKIQRLQEDLGNITGNARLTATPPDSVPITCGQTMKIGERRLAR